MLWVDKNSVASHYEWYHHTVQCVNFFVHQPLFFEGEEKSFDSDFVWQKTTFPPQSSSSEMRFTRVLDSLRSSQGWNQIAIRLANWIGRPIDSSSKPVKSLFSLFSNGFSSSYPPGTLFDGHGDDGGWWAFSQVCLFSPSHRRCIQDTVGSHASMASGWNHFLSPFFPHLDASDTQKMYDLLSWSTVVFLCRQSLVTCAYYKSALFGLNVCSAACVCVVELINGNQNGHTRTVWRSLVSLSLSLSLARCFPGLDFLNSACRCRLLISTRWKWNLPFLQLFGSSVDSQPDDRPPVFQRLLCLAGHCNNDRVHEATRKFASFFLRIAFVFHCLCPLGCVCAVESTHSK